MQSKQVRHCYRNVWGKRCCREFGGRLLAAEEIAWVKSDSTGQNKLYKR